MIARYSLNAFLFIFLSVTAVIPAAVQAQDLASLPDPIFVKTPEVSSDIESREGFTLYFSYDYDRCRAHYGDNYYRGCQRRLELDGKRADDGITLTPPMPGEWRWRGDYALSFTPDDTWPAGTSYELGLDLDALGVPESVLLSGDQRQATVRFSTRPLVVSFPEMRFMQAPSDPARKVITAELRTNYPVDLSSIKDHLRFQRETGRKSRLDTADWAPEYEIIPDASGAVARVNVTLGELPGEEQFMRLLVNPGLEPRHGGLASWQAFSERVRIPTLSSYLEIQTLEAAILRSENGTPDQALSLSLNVKARPEEVRTHLKAFLLPEQHPVSRGSGDGQPYRWEADNEVTPAILALSEPLDLNLMASGEEYATVFSFPVTAPEGRYVFVTAAPELPAFGGYTLGREFRSITRVPEWPHDLEISQKGSIMTLSGAKKLSLHARGTDRLEVEVAQIRPQALQHFISQTSGDIGAPSFTNWSFRAEDIAEIDVARIPMHFENARNSQYAAFDFSPYLKDEKKGLFLLTIRGYRNDKAAGTTSQRFVLVTDMGLLVKEGGNGNRDVYLASFTKGAPVKGADVSVLGRNGLPVFASTTDADGHVSLPAFEGYTKDREPVAVVARKDGDYSFIPWDRDDRTINLSKFETGGAVTMAEGLNAQLFSDRGIYRPGETLRVGAIVRNADWTPLPEGLPLQLVITDPRGRTVLDEILPFPPEGLQEASLETGENWPTGSYHAALHISDDGKPGGFLGSTALRVEEFQPDRLRIEAAFPDAPQGWLRPDGARAHVKLANLYGTPATQRRVKASVTLNPAILRFEAFPEYRFFDAYPARPRSVQYDLPDAETGADGQASLPLKLGDQEPATYSLHLETRGFEAGSGRGVTTYSTALVSPMRYVIGYRTDAQLSWLAKGKDYHIDLLALSPDLGPVAAEALTLEHVRRTFVSSLIRRGDGSYAYESVPKEEIISEKPFAVPAGGIRLDIPADEPGRYALRLKAADGIVVADIPYAVAGEGQRAAGLDKEAALDVRIDKDSYDASDDIKISITAPYAGAGLITLESDRVLAHKWFRMTATDTVETIRVPDGFSGKGYVSVALVRDLNSPEIYMSPLSYAAVPFTANTQARTLELNVSTPEMARPGEPVTISYSANGSGKAILYAVDEGILQVARYQTPDPVRFFLLDRALQVRTSQMLDLLMPEFDLLRKLSADGGGASAEEAALGKHLNPFKRKTLAPAVYWSGIVEVSEEQRTVIFTPPGHFNGTMRVMAVGVSDAGVGSAEEEVVLQGELIVTPGAPLFLAPGDTAEFSLTVANNVEGSGTDAGVAVTVVSESLAIGDIPASMAIPEGTEISISYPVTAKDTPGPAALTVRAGLKEEVQEATATLSIRPPVPLETTMTSGYERDGEAKIAFTRALYPQSAERHVALSPLPTAYIYGLMRYLNAYPYGCTEQTVSRAVPHLSLSGLPEFAAAEEKAEERLSQALSTLRRRQTPDGGFAMWEGGQEPHDFITVYALDFLVQAREGGIPVPAEVTERGLRYLRDWVNRDIGELDDARLKAYGIYVLTRSGIVTTNEIFHVTRYLEKRKDWRSDLAAVYIAAAYKLMRQDALADETLAAFEAALSPADMSYSEGAWDKPWHNPFIETARYITLAATHFPGRTRTLDDQALVFRLAAFVNEGRYSTISSSFAVQALADYAREQSSALSAESLGIRVDGKALAVPEGALSFSVPPAAQEISFKSSGRPLFYTLTETGFDRTLPDKAAASKMDIERTYLTPDGTPLAGTVALGDVVEAVIKVRAHDSRRVENVAIVDLLPGGFEPELDSTGQNSTLLTDFVDRREDRVIAFGTVTPTERVFRYRMRAVSKGTFTVPPPFAEAMYDPTIKARGLPGAITVTDQQ